MSAAILFTSSSYLQPFIEEYQRSIWQSIQIDENFCIGPRGQEDHLGQDPLAKISRGHLRGSDLNLESLGETATISRNVGDQIQRCPFPS